AGGKCPRRICAAQRIGQADDPPSVLPRWPGGAGGVSASSARCGPGDAEGRGKIMMRLLLSSGGLRTEERVRFFGEQMRQLVGDVERLLFVPYALRDHDGYLQAIVERKLHGGEPIGGIHQHPDPGTAVREAQAIFIGGGNTFRLLSDLYRLNLLDTIRECVRNGTPYVGVSAGTNVACPTIKTTNDMPITMPPSLDALGLVPFQINPHYFSGTTYVKVEDGYREHFGETREDRIREFHEMNDTPVLGLWEGGLLRVEQGAIWLAGAPARLFRKGQEPVDLEPGTRLEELLAG